jgi:hypothetical protein
LDEAHLSKFSMHPGSTKIVAEPTWITPAQVRKSTLKGSNVLQMV